jgi:hypothetical protein
MSSIKCKQAREEEIYTKKTTLLSIFIIFFMEKDTIVKEWLEFVETQFFWGSWKNSATFNKKG